MVADSKNNLRVWLHVFQEETTIECTSVNVKYDYVSTCHVTLRHGHAVFGYTRARAVSFVSWLCSEVKIALIGWRAFPARLVEKQARRLPTTSKEGRCTTERVGRQRVVDNDPVCIGEADRLR